MSNKLKQDEIIFNFFKQICDENDDLKCIELGNNWIKAMETNILNMQNNLEESDKKKFKKDIDANKKHLDGLKNQNASEWREYAKNCMIEIIENKTS